MTDRDLPAPTPEQERIVQQAARALSSAGLVTAYGHCSLRLTPEAFLVCAAQPMGLIGEDRGTVVTTDGPLPEGVLGEVRAHQAIYRARPDIGGICRILPPTVIALSTQGILPAPRHGIGAYLAQAKFWNDSRLLRDDALAKGLADELGDGPAIVMRANGAIVVGDTLEKAVTLSVFLEQAAVVEREVRAMGFDPETGILTPEEIGPRQTFAGRVVERMWTWLTEKAPIVP